jgi:arylsulfatase
LLDYLTGKTKESPRQLYFYFSDDGDVLGIRFDNWKVVFMEQRCQGTLRIWAEPFTPLRVPKVFNLRTDPYERADITSNTYYDWCLHNLYFIFAAQTVAAKFVETFKEFPPAQHPGTFTIDAAMAKMSEASSGANH